MFVLFGLHLIPVSTQQKERWLVCWLFEQSVSNIYNLLFIMRDSSFALNSTQLSIVSFNFIQDHQLFIVKGFSYNEFTIRKFLIFNEIKKIEIIHGQLFSYLAYSFFHTSHRLVLELFL